MGPSNLQNFENASPIEIQSFIQGPPIPKKFSVV
jgi:hypothetical protein